MTDLTASIAQCMDRDYGRQLPRIFEIPSIQMKNLVFEIEILGISNQKFWNTRFSHLEFEILGNFEGNA